MSHWQFECISRPQEKMTHLLISQGDGSMGRYDEHCAETETNRSNMCEGWLPEAVCGASDGWPLW